MNKTLVTLYFDKTGELYLIEDVIKDEVLCCTINNKTKAMFSVCGILSTCEYNEYLGQNIAYFVNNKMYKLFNGKHC